MSMPAMFGGTIAGSCASGTDRSAAVTAQQVRDDPTLRRGDVSDQGAADRGRDLIERTAQHGDAGSAWRRVVLMSS